MAPGIDARTLYALDWAAILEALAGRARTARGRAAAARPDFAADRGAALARYAAVAEVLALEEEAGLHIPVGAVGDVAAAVSAAAGGAVLEGWQLRGIGETLFGLRQLRRWLDERRAVAPTLRDLAEPIAVEPELLDTLRRSFEESGELSERMYPQLADLRARIRDLGGRIRGILSDLVQGDSLAGMLQDRFVTERAGRFVIPVKTTYRRQLGVVHGTSQSGETVYVEPLEVIAHTNELKEAEAALEREIRRILTTLSRMVAAEADPIQASLDAATEVDLACARAGLGIQWKGSIPAVGSRGELLLQAARHPVLQLRGVDVVGNDLSLTAAHPGLVLTGPNAGGKTVALKTLGLAALLVRAGIPLPAHPDSRADFFSHVVADVGDMQSVSGDLSTFSGHLAVLKGILADGGPGSLVLLDELGMGTDPAQGAALAVAVVQTLLDQGARVSVTTHFDPLKRLPEGDLRVRVGAVRFVDGRPTYQLDLGRAGQSHAFAIARRMDFPEAVLDRARALLTAEERRLESLIATLESDREAAAEERRVLQDRLKELSSREGSLAGREAALAQRQARLEKEVAEGFRRRLREREAEIKSLIAALQADPNLKDASAALQRVRAIDEEVRPAPPPPALGPPPRDLQVGDRVRHRTLGSRGHIARVLGDDTFEVAIGQMRMKVGLQDLVEGQPVLEHREKEKKAKIEEQLPPPVQATLVSVRTPGNTCDLRGRRVDEALEEAELFLDEMLREGLSAAYLLHGHGTGALKAAIRDWLPQCRGVKRWRPALPHEGGDAYTLVELR